MIIHHPFPRNTTACPSENPSCLANQSNNTNFSQPTGAITHTPVLTHTNLVGVLVIVVLLVLGIALWLCFGRWSKPIRQFFRGEPRSKQDSTVDNNPAGATSAATGRDCADPEKAVWANSGSSSSSSHGSFDQDAIEVGKGPAPPEKVLHAFTIKSGSQLASLNR